MKESTLMNSLLQAPICRGLTEPELATILEITEETTARDGQWIFKEDDPGDALYIVLRGQIDIQKKDRNGGQQQLARIGDGSVIGEMSLISGHSVRSASALAVTDAKLLKIPTARFSHLLAQANLAALKVVHNLAQVMSRRLLLMDEKLVEMAVGRRKEELLDFQRILTNWSF